ncbi:MAG: alpha/beta hydrolase [Pseudomonadota bacterium]
MQMDAEYDNAAHTPGAADYPNKWAAKAEAFRKYMLRNNRASLDQPYGDTPRQSSDYFFPSDEPKGLCVFVHGGYWRRFDRSYWSHMAAGPLAHGWAISIPSYDLCPDVQVRDITLQIAAAVEKAANEFSGPIKLFGHSAGGHLVTRMLQPGMLPEPVVSRLARVTPISMVSDLRPLIQTSINDQLQLDEESAIAESPIFMEQRHSVPIEAWVGGAELPAFIDQSRWFARAWACELNILPNMNHFTVVEALEDPQSPLTLGCIND